MDELKKMLQTHKAALDTDIPDEKIFSLLEKRLHPEKRMRKVYTLTKTITAACVFTFVVAGFYFLQYQASDKNNLLLTKTTERMPELSGSAIQSDKISLPEQLAMTTKIKKQNNVKKEAPQSKKNIAYTELEKVFQLMARNYVKQINAMPIYGENSSYFSIFKKQLLNLDQEEIAVRDNLAFNGTSEDKVSMLIDIYEIRINLLKKLKSEISKINRLANKAVVSPTPSYLKL